MVLLLLLSSALAAPPDYKPIKQVAGCTLNMGPVQDDGVAPMLAECHWPEADVAALQERLGHFDAYDQYIYAIVSDTVVRAEGNRTLVHQVQEAPVIADREVLVWMEKVPVEGGFRFTWKDDPDEPLTVAKGNIRAERNEGYWEVTADPEGGAHVVHFIAYNPGGSVPAWVVKQFQTSGMARVMEDMRRIAEG